MKAVVAIAALAATGYAGFFDKTPTSTPSTSYSESYSQSVKATTIPGDIGDPADPFDNIPASVEYSIVFRYSGTATVVASLEGFDIAQFAPGNAIEIKIGEYTFSTVLDAGAVAAKKVVLNESAVDRDAGTSSSERVTVTWNPRSLSASISLAESGPDAFTGGFRLGLADTSSSFSGPDSALASVKIASVTGTRRLLGRQTGRVSQTVRRTPVPSLPGEPPEPPLEEVFDLFSFTASGGTDYVPAPLAFAAPISGGISHLPSVVVTLTSDITAEEVFVRVNGGSWTAASGGPDATSGTLTNSPWSVAMPLAAGPNKLEAYAIDLSGNVTPTIVRNISYEPLIGPFVATLKNGGGDVEGRVEILVGKTGIVTGRLYLGATSLTIRGTAAANGVLTLALSGTGSAGASVQSQLTATADQFTTFTGTATIGGQTYAVAGSHAPFDARTQFFTDGFPAGTLLGEPIPVAVTGRAAPEGFAFAVVNAPTTGSLRVVGELPDGTRISIGSRFDSTSSAIVTLPLYRAPNAGSLTGKLQIVGGTVSGDLLWKRPAQPGLLYPLAFTLQLRLSGAQFVPGTIQRIVAPPDPPTVEEFPPTGYTDGLVTLVDVDDLQAIERNVMIGGLGKVSAASGPEKLLLSINNASGLVTGSFLDVTTNKRRAIRGAIVTGSQGGGGYSEGPTATGSFRLGAKPAP